MDMNMVWLSIGLKFCMLTMITQMLVRWWLRKVRDHSRHTAGLAIRLLIALAVVAGAIILFGYWIQSDLQVYIK
jgi:hypothetical protein